MQAHPVGDFTRGPQHGRPDGGHGNWNPGQAERSGREIRRGQGERVMLAMIVQRFLGLPGAPDRANRADIVAHARRRRAPGNAVAALVMSLHLRAEPEIEPPPRQFVQIPGRVRRDRGAAGKGDHHGGAELNPFRRHGRRRQRRDRAMRVLQRHDAIEAGILRRLGHGLRLAGVVVGDLINHAHGKGSGDFKALKVARQ